MTIYLISGAFFYAYRQGKKIANLDTLINSNKLGNEARKKIKEINEKYQKTVRGIDRDRALNFWRGVRGDKSKKP